MRIYSKGLSFLLFIVICYGSMPVSADPLDRIFSPVKISQTQSIFNSALNITLDTNNPPIANDDYAETDANTAIDIDVLANDTDLDSGDTLQILEVSQPENGTVSINSNGTVHYEPLADFRGIDLFLYMIHDNKDASGVALVTVKVGRNTEPPIVVNDNLEMEWNTALDIDVLANDTDIDIGDILSVSNVTQPEHGTTSINVDGSVHYVPVLDFIGYDNFQYTVMDSGGLSTEGTVMVRVYGPNNPPIANDDYAETDVNTAIDIDILANDTDSDLEDILQILDVSQPEYGMITTNFDGTIHYEPLPDFRGMDMFLYMIHDNKDTSGVAAVTVKVGINAEPPIAVNDYLEMEWNTAIDIDVLANDIDIDPGDTLSVSNVTQPEHGTSTINADGSIHYVPSLGFLGYDSFYYTVSDSGGLLAEAWVSIRVYGPNNPPVANDDFVETDANTAIDINVLANDTESDPEDVIFLYDVIPPQNGEITINFDESIHYEPHPDFVGEDVFQYAVHDYKDVSNIATVTVKVGSVVESPIIAFVDVSPQMAARGDSITIVAGVMDDVQVTRVVANGVDLSDVGDEYWTGTITADAAIGNNIVTITAYDDDNNVSTDTSGSYRTVPVVALNNRSIFDPIMGIACDNYFFTAFGIVTVMDTDFFALDDGSGWPIMVAASGHNLVSDKYARVRGRLFDYGSETPYIYVEDVLKHIKVISTPE